MAAMTISLALAMDFLLLPTLLMKVEGNGEEGGCPGSGTKNFPVCD